MAEDPKEDRDERADEVDAEEDDGPAEEEEAEEDWEEDEAEDEEDEAEDEEDEAEDEEDEEEEETTHVPPEVLAGWCGKCAGRCCRYYTVYLDDPEDADDFDEFRWFLAHEKCYLYIDDGKWHMNVEARCRFLGDEGRCAIYEHRPDVCREFGHEDECEWTGEFDFERTFRTIRDLEVYAKEALDPEEYAKLAVLPDDWDGPS